jgi:hypothetical protein
VRDFDTFIERIRRDNKEGDVARLRREVDLLSNEEGEYEHMLQMARIYPAVVMGKSTDGMLEMKAFNGVVLLSVGGLYGDDEVRMVKQVAQLLPMTLAAFMGSSGRSVKILVSVEPESGKLPADSDALTAFYQDAYEQVSLLYQSMLPFRLMPVEKSMLTPMNASFRMTLDEAPYVNPHVAPLKVAEAALLRKISASRLVPVAATKTDDEQVVGKETKELMDFLGRNYRFRFNSVMGYTEYSIKNGHSVSWLPVDERMQNRLSMEARLAGINIWDKDMNRYLKSAIIHEYNPIHEYLWRVKDLWDGKDHIGRLAATVPTDNKHWPQWFRTWMLAMVAQWLGKNTRYGNSVAPLLISHQGYNKSTFCKSLIPHELQWGYNDNLQMGEKKSVLQAMSQFLLINLDEFNSISPKIQEGFLKNVIQLSSVKVKRPYGRHVEEFPRLASFIATANMNDILADPSGNRRFIGIELTGPIKVEQRIDHEQLYAQVMNALDEGEPYWFDQEQTELIMESNRQFQSTPPVMQFFHECFDIVQNANEGVFMTTAAIFSEVKKVAGSDIKLSTLNSFGRLLTNLPELQHRRSRRGTEYLVRKRIL